MTATTLSHPDPRPILVLGATGKVGRRVAARLTQLGEPVRAASRSSRTRFDWADETTWRPALEGARAAYVVYAPDLAQPEAPARIEAFAQLAVQLGVERLVLLSGRGEADAQRCEQIVLRASPGATVVRASWFAQNFTEAFFHGPLMEGTLALPVGRGSSAVAEPFVDVEDIAEVVVAALTEARHAGEIYEVTGPRLLTFPDAVEAIAQASGRELSFVEVPMEAYAEGMRAAGQDEGLVELMRYLFTTVLDGRNAFVTDDVRRALGRPARDFTAFARDAAAGGAWGPPDHGAHADPRAVLRRFVDEVLNGGEFGALEDLVADDYVHRAPGQELRGREGLISLVQGYRTAFPDFHVREDELHRDGDSTVMVFTLTGTHRGELLGRAPTGRAVNVRGVVRSRHDGGRIAEEWELLDRLSLVEQLGLSEVAS